MTSKKPPKALCVTVVSDNPETLDGIEMYFQRAGVPTQTARTVDDPRTLTSAATTAVILFPDDFEHAAALAFVAKLRHARPRLLLLLLTREPQRFSEAVAPDGRSLPPLVLPRPSFGWAILEAIRSTGVADSAPRK